MQECTSYIWGNNSVQVRGSKCSGFDRAVLEAEKHVNKGLWTVILYPWELWRRPRFPLLVQFSTPG